MPRLSKPTEMLDRNKLMRYLLAKYTLKECAALMGVQYHTIRARVKKPEFMEELRVLDGEMFFEVDQELKVSRSMMNEKVLELSEKALDKLEQLLDSDGTDDRVVARIAMDLLDRNPESSKTHKVEGEITHNFINPTLLAAAALAAREMDETTHGPLLNG